MLNNGKDSLGKFDAKAYEGLFLGYSSTSKAYRFFNKNSLKIEEFVHVVFDKSNPQKEGKVSVFDDDVGSPREVFPRSEEVVINKPQEGPSSQHNYLPKEWRAPKDFFIDNIIEDIEKGVTTRHSLNLFCEHTTFVSQVEPLSIEETLKDEFWIISMHEALNQFKRNHV